VDRVVKRFRSGESVAAIAPDYELTVLQVENAIRYAMLSRRRRKHWVSMQLGTELTPNPDRAYPREPVAMAKQMRGDT
jgi:hypothetical protein